MSVGSAHPCYEETLLNAVEVVRQMEPSGSTTTTTTVLKSLVVSSTRYKLPARSDIRVDARGVRHISILHARDR